MRGQLDGEPGRPCATAHGAAALAFTKAATPTAAAARTATSARVPLLVVKMTVRPPTRAGENSSGELPRSKPCSGSPLRSPAMRAPGVAAA